MELSPSWEAKRSTARQEMIRMLCNPKVHNRIHKSPLPAPTFSYINPALALMSLPGGPF
jgi:hypothetical protein